MTDTEKYNELLKELGELLKSKNNTIAVQQWEIDDLKRKLAAAEEKNNTTKEGNE